MKQIITKILILLILDFNLLAEAKTGLVLTNDFANLISSNEKYVKVTLFKFYKKSRSHAVLNITYTLMQDITSDDTKISIAALQFRSNEYKRTTIDLSIGICTFYRTNKFGVFDFMKDSNLSGCPFPKGGYYINDIAPTADSMPPFFPEGKWLFDLTFTNSGALMARVHWMVSITKNIVP